MERGKKMIKRDKYYLGQYRYYELKYFCLQYDKWEKAYKGIIKAIEDMPKLKIKHLDSNKMLKELEDSKIYFKNRIDLINEVAKETTEKYSEIMIRAVTDNDSYMYLKELYPNILGKDEFVDLYKKFFYILDKKRK